MCLRIGYVGRSSCVIYVSCLRWKLCFYHDPHVIWPVYTRATKLPPGTRPNVVGETVWRRHITLHAKGGDLNPSGKPTRMSSESCFPPSHPITEGPDGSETETWQRAEEAGPISNHYRTAGSREVKRKLGAEKGGGGGCCDWDLRQRRASRGPEMHLEADDRGGVTGGGESHVLDRPVRGRREYAHATVPRPERCED